MVGLLSLPQIYAGRVVVGGRRPAVAREGASAGAAAQQGPARPHRDLHLGHQRCCR
uniref:Uncharacterized protein n=1 Tax=Arundo donax TaxID=35708 RepID=A0A0A9EUE6_ARUDO